MNTIDLTQLGGFPFEQDTLEFMQSSTKEMLAMLFADVPANQAVIISGMVESSSMFGVVLSAGYFYYNGEVYKFSQSSTGFISIGQSLCVNITPSTTGVVVFEDNSSHNVYITQNAVLAKTSATVSASNQILLRDMKLLHEYLAARGKEPWKQQPITGSPFSGTLYYRKNSLTNQLDLRASLTISNAQTIANPPMFYSPFTFPVGYRPTSKGVFTCYIRYHQNIFTDANGVGYITALMGEVMPAGSMSIGLMRPAAGVTTYTIEFNATINLD